MDHEAPVRKQYDDHQEPTVLLECGHDERERKRQQHSYKMNTLPFLVVGLLVMAALIVTLVVVLDPPPEFQDPAYEAGPWCQVDRVPRVPDDLKIHSGTWTVTEGNQTTLFREYEGKPWTIQSVKTDQPPRSVSAYGSTLYISEEGTDRVIRFDRGSGPKVFATGPVQRIEVFGPATEDVWMQFEGGAIYCGQTLVTYGTGVLLGRVNGRPAIHDGEWSFTFDRCSA